MRYALYFLSFAFGAFVLAAVLGSQVPATYSESLSASSASETLSFVFGLESGEVVEIESAQGSIHHGALTRRSFIHGTASDGQGEFAEQVLKVGWPFTIARGFVHVSPEGSHTHGLSASSLENGIPAKGVMPFQPVWPGVIFWGLVGLVLATLPGFTRRSGPV